MASYTPLAPTEGGLWRENYSSYALQVPKQFYEFPDFPFVAVPWGDYPTGAQTAHYIKAYAKHFDLMGCVALKTEITALNLRKDGKPGWTVKVQPEGGSVEEEDFDFVVVATGMYSSPANMPSYEGRADFAGQVIHSSQYLSQDIAKGKKVVVVGSSKSAIDIIVDTSKVAAAPPTMVARHFHWSTPRLIAGFIPFQFIFLSRFGQALVSWYKGPWPVGAPCYFNLLRCLLFPIMWVAFRLVELIIAIQHCMFFEHLPPYDVVKDFYGHAHILNREFFRLRGAGSLISKQGEIAKLENGKVILKSGESIDADLVICATGFEKTYDYLPSEVQKQLMLEADGLYLYHHCIPAGVRKLNLAFCGSEVASISNIMTHGIHAEYICRIFKGLVQLPSDEEMNAECKTMMDWKRGWMPETSARANLVLLHQIHYHDQLLREMGENPSRKGWLLPELFCPYMPSDYDGIIGAATGELAFKF